MELLDRVLGIGRRQSGDAPAPRSPLVPIDPTDIDLADLEAGTAPTSPVISSALSSDPSNAERGDPQRRMSQPEVIFAQSQVGSSSSESRREESHDRGHPSPGAVPPSIGTGNRAARWAAAMPLNLGPSPDFPPHKEAQELSNRGRDDHEDIPSARDGVRFISPPKAENSYDGGHDDDDDDDDEVASGRSGVRFVPPADNMKKAHRRGLTRSSIPSDYWKNLAPEAEFLRRAANQILSQGSDERAQRRMYPSFLSPVPS
jgi:hypothetical protein